MLEEGRLPDLTEAFFRATRHWDIGLHFNKGLAGASAEAIEVTRATAINPIAIESFALAICGGGEGPCYPGVSGHEPHVEKARSNCTSIRLAVEELRKVVTNVGSYWSESDYFESNWEHAFWGEHATRLLTAKERSDPGGLFGVHHGIAAH